MPDGIERKALVFEFPITSLCGDTRCKACRLFWEDREAWEVMTESLLRGDMTLAQLVEYLASRGHKFSDDMLSRHRTGHMKESLFAIAGETKQLEVLARMAMNIPSGDLATAMVRLACGAIIEGLKEIKPGAMRKLAKDDPMAYLDFSSKYARAISAVQATDNQAALNAAKLELEKIKLNQGAAALLTRAMQALHKELSSSPEGLKLLGAIDHFVNSPKP